MADVYMRLHQSKHQTTELLSVMTKTMKKKKKNSVFECYVAILFLNISENFNRELGGGWSKKKNSHKKGNSAANTCFITIRIIFISCLH